MKIKQTIHQDRVVIRPIGNLHLTSAFQLQQTLLTRLAGQPTGIVIDLAELTGVDRPSASVLRAILRRLCHWPHTAVALCRPRASIASILTAHGVPQLMPLFSTLKEAIAAVGAEAPFRHARLSLGPRHAQATAGRLAEAICLSWHLDELVDRAAHAATELVTVAGHDEGAPILEVEWRGNGLYMAVRGTHPDGPVPLDDLIRRADPLHQRSSVWGIERAADGGQVAWCVLDTDDAAEHGGQTASAAVRVGARAARPGGLGAATDGLA